MKLEAVLKTSNFPNSKFSREFSLFELVMHMLIRKVASMNSGDGFQNVGTIILFFLRMYISFGRTLELN